MGGAFARFSLALVGFVWAQCACGPRCWPVASPSIWPVRVYSYQLGSSQSFGQDPQYFPYNVLGEICTSATPTNPCADPCQVVSLGKGGFIALEFDPPIADGPGPDFTVFENPFRYGSGQVFDEWMIVSVSQDGINWVVFPFDSITGQGLAGRTPTGCMGCSGPINWQDPSQSGGDAFDLSVVGLAWAKYVRVTDATSWQPPDRLSADLDGIVAIHQLSSNSLAYQIGPTGVTIRSLVQPLFEAWNLLGQPISAEVREIGEGTWIIRPFGPAVVRIYTPTGMQQVKGFFAPMD